MALHRITSHDVTAARNRLLEKPIIVTEDTTMIRLLSSLEKHQGQAALMYVQHTSHRSAAPAGTPQGDKPSGSVRSFRHSARDKQRQAAKQNTANEARSIYMNLPHDE